MPRYAAFFCLLLSSMICLHANAEVKRQWVEDEVFGFKIQVPSNYQKNSLLEGTDKIHAFLSPDQNLAVRVRVIPLGGNQVTPEQLEKLWRDNVLVGAKSVGAQKDEMNGLKGTTYGYRWTFNNTPCIVGAFITVAQDMAYVVWCCAPESIFQNRAPEMAAITKSFNLVKLKAAGQAGLATNADKPAKPQKPLIPGLNPAQPATDPSRTDSSGNAQAQWLGLVLDDCMVEFEMPAGFTKQLSEPGQSQWWDANTAEAARVKMIIQSLDRKAGNTMESVVKGFLNQVKSSDAATLIKSNLVTHPQLPVHHISFTYDPGGGNVTIFRYAVVDAPGPVVVAVSFVTPKANDASASLMHEHMVASLKPVNPQAGGAKAPPGSVDDTTSKGAWMKMNQAARHQDWDTLVTCLDGEAVQKVILDRMVNEGSVDLTGLPEDPLERLSALLKTNAKVKQRMGSFGAEGEIFNIREENDQMHLIMVKLKDKSEGWFWMKKRKGRWVFAPN